MLLQISLIILLHLLIPFILVAWIARGRPKSKFDWLLRVLLSAAYIAFIFVAGMWAFVSYYGRYVTPCLFGLAVLWSIGSVKTIPFFIRKEASDWIKNGAVIATACLLMVLFVVSVRRSPSHVEGVALEFPLRHGTYSILQGSNNPLTNFFHNVNPTQKNALDIVKLNRAGMLGNGIFPGDCSGHEIFGDTVYSPISGVIAEAVDGFPDLKPSFNDSSYPAGNHVVIDSAGIRIMIAHLLNGSVIVHTGDSVYRGNVIGRVGNSGNTSLPHLHIHAEINGTAVPMLFRERILSMNDLMTFSEVYER